MTPIRTILPTWMRLIMHEENLLSTTFVWPGEPIPMKVKRTKSIRIRFRDLPEYKTNVLFYIDIYEGKGGMKYWRLRNHLWITKGLLPDNDKHFEPGYLVMLNACYPAGGYVPGSVKPKATKSK